MCFRGNEAVEFLRSKVVDVSRMRTKENQDTYEGYLDSDSVNLGCERWTFLCNHNLQPLRFCLESVRSEFLHMAHHYDLIDTIILDKLVKDAKRLSTGKVNKKKAASIKTAATLERKRQNGGIGGLGCGSNPLKSFFPFDPLLLHGSHQYVEPMYRHWNGPVEEDDELLIDMKNEDLLVDETDRPTSSTQFYMDEDCIAQPDYSYDNYDIGDIDEDNNDDHESHDESEMECSVDKSENECFHSPVNENIKLLQKKAWTETMKRPRSQSMDSGSW